MKFLFLFLLIGVSLSAGDLQVRIEHSWKGEKLQVPSGLLTTAEGERISITRLDYLLSEPSIYAQQSLKRTDWFAFASVGKHPVHLVVGGVPEGTYSGVGLQIGPDPITDVADPTVYPANHPMHPLVNKLHWEPQGGYIYLALEGYLENGDGFAYHLGNPANRIPLHWEVDFDVESSTVVDIDFRVDRLFEGLKVSDVNSTHSRPGDLVAENLKRQLATSFDLVSVSSNNSAPSEVTKSVPQAMVGTPYRFELSRGFPQPGLPEDVPMSNERVSLGKKLFHDERLSGSNTTSCASCHFEEKAFTDGQTLSTGEGGVKGRRNSMPLLNLAWKRSFFWDGRSPSLREQVLDPIQDPAELNAEMSTLIVELETIPEYPPLFEAAFGDESIDADRIALALEQFLLSLTSYDSKFDRAAAGKTELSEQEKRGFELFMTEYDPRRGLYGADCFHCHGGAFFTDHAFRNNGLEPGSDLGLEEATGLKSDRFKFATPSLRNVELTAPYMHDGRFESLEEVVEHYSGPLNRSANLDPNLAKHPADGIGLSSEDQEALVAFLKSLTDPDIGD